jgi:hypothetical protein
MFKPAETQSASRHGQIHMQQNLLSLCWQSRRFLEPRWLLLHQLWGTPQPDIPSKYMCRYTSIFLKKVLNIGAYAPWRLVAGRPIVNEYEETQKGCFGFRTSSGLLSDHCWVQSTNLIVDITADQFGTEAVIITSVNDSRYSPNLEEVDFYKEIEKLSHHPEKWLREWHGQHEDRENA